jgi:N-acetylglucosamine kinase-like BadF-type ATPase
MATLIADSGGTKTDWVYVHDAQQIKIKTPGLHPFYMDSTAMQQTIEATLLPALEPLPSPAAIFFYGAGCSSQEKKLQVTKALAAAFPKAHIEVEHDMLGAARALWGHRQGIAAILGTGANVCFYDGQVITNNPPSLGFWLGDEGSGAYLGREWVKHYLHGMLPNALQEAFRMQYALRLDDVLQAAYHSAHPNRYFAQFVPFLKEYCTDEYVVAFLRHAFDLFFERYLCKIEDYYLYPAAFTGSVAFHFQEPLLASAQSFDVQVVRIEQSPLSGLLKYHGMV